MINIIAAFGLAAALVTTTVNGVDDTRWVLPDAPAPAIEAVAANEGDTFPVHDGCYVVPIEWRHGSPHRVLTDELPPFQVSVVGQYLWLDLVGEWEGSAFNNPDVQSVLIEPGTDSVIVCPVTAPEPEPEPEAPNCLVLEITRRADGAVVDLTPVQQADPVIFYGRLGHYIVTADGPFDINGNAPGVASVEMPDGDTFTACR